VENQILLPLEALADTVEVEGMERDTDYTVFYTDDNCAIEFLTDTTTAQQVSYDAVDPSMVTKSDIIGGYSVTTHKTTGLELIDDVFPKYTLAPDIIVCPNWSHDNEVAAVMSAKAENINGVFEAEALIELPSDSEEGATWYTDVPALKKRMNIFNVNQLCCWPKVKLGDRVFDYTVQLAGSMSKTDNSGEFGDGTPCESASNKVLRADSMVLANGEEVRLDVPKANYLNDNGIITCVNFYNGFVSWGNYTSAFPANTDPVDYFYSINRMFKYIAKTVILTSWNDVDRRITRRLLDAIMQGVNYWLNSLTAEEKILGGRVEMLESENALTNLMAGRVKFHIYVTPPSPLQQLNWVMEYDLSYLQVLLSPAA
ncbi:MAG: phage tail protein, partial [Lachnospiraceae bacterium]|nr:phage tail protein [Lachnospiraceae bacterium]